MRVRSHTIATMNSAVSALSALEDSMMWKMLTEFNHPPTGVEPRRG
jgi:hypothetical protein